MRSEQDFETFVRKWRNAFLAPRPVWEGQRAVAELKRSVITKEPTGERVSTLSFVMGDPVHRWRPNEMLKKVFYEVIDYKKQKVRRQSEFRQTEELFAGIYRKLTKNASRANDEFVKYVLNNSAKSIERTRVAVRDFEARTHSPLGIWEELWPNHPRVQRVGRRIDLDSRLQIQVAKMLRIFLIKEDGVSRRTVARLVVLVYLIAGLASERKDRGRLWIDNSQHLLSVRAVEEKLVRNRIR